MINLTLTGRTKLRAGSQFEPAWFPKILEFRSRMPERPALKRALAGELSEGASDE